MGRFHSEIWLAKVTNPMLCMVGMFFGSYGRILVECVVFSDVVRMVLAVVKTLDSRGKGKGWYLQW